MFSALNNTLNIFAVGAVVGSFLAFIYIKMEEVYMESPSLCTSNSSKNEDRVPLNMTFIAEKLQMQVNSTAEDLLVFDELKVKNIRVACLVQTFDMYHNSKAKLVKNTWGNRCDVLVFESNKPDTALPSVSFSSLPQKTYYWGRTKKALKYMYEKHSNQFDWLIRSDHNAYVIVENLRLLLSQYDTTSPIQLGYRLKSYTPEGHINGDGGHVLSKEALKRLVERGLKQDKLCRMQDDGNVDQEMGQCLYNLGVKTVDTRDSQQRWRFFYFDPIQHLPGAPPIADKNFWSTTYYPYKEGSGCCSSSPIAWRMIHRDMVGVLEYLLYDLRTFGHPHPLANISVEDILYQGWP